MILVGLSIWVGASVLELLLDPSQVEKIADAVGEEPPPPDYPWPPDVRMILTLAGGLAFVLGLVTVLLLLARKDMGQGPGNRNT